ncbi:hypothetical protein EDD17DRAFT_517497 [Pisolithus thermaeus]|nr:hypothetical protein EV401DRAFT_879362 [Pisolithus croceorrhizus]KAI6163174.1 hypothetical protein EDD17DRAFT_517497 [Pisolithus thermaeus]
MTSDRKRPQCHQCGTMMRGHKRQGRGKYICPDSSISSTDTDKDRAASEFNVTESLSTRSHSSSTPLPSPPVSLSPSPSPVPPPAYTPTFKPPPGSSWHWKNPNWKSPPRNFGFRGLPELDRSSLTPTEPNTEYQASIQGDHFASSVTLQEVKQELTGGSEPVWGIENDDNGDLGSTHSEYFNAFTPMPVDTQSRSWSPWSHSSGSSDNLSGVLRAGTPLFNVVRTRRRDIPKLTRAAEEEGKHMCIIDAPPSYPGTAKLPREKANGTVWVLVSDREDDLRYALDCQQRGMPGALLFDQQTAKRSGILEVVFASFVGGFIVALGFKYL